MSKYKLVETGEKTRVLTFRVSETIYSALKHKAEERGETISSYARKVLMDNIELEEVSVGDTVRLDTGVHIILMEGTTANIKEINRKIKKMTEHRRKENEAQLES